MIIVFSRIQTRGEYVIFLLILMFTAIYCYVYFTVNLWDCKEHDLLYRLNSFLFNQTYKYADFYIKISIVSHRTIVFLAVAKIVVYLL